MRLLAPDVRSTIALSTLLAATCGGCAGRGPAPAPASPPPAAPPAVDARALYDSACVTAEAQQAALECPPGSRPRAAPRRARLEAHEALAPEGPAAASPRAEPRDWRSLEARYHALVEASGDELCVNQARLANASRHGRSKREQLDLLRQALDQMDAFVAADHPAAAEWACRQAVAGTLLGRATEWHAEAAGTPSGPGTNDRATMELADELYGLVLARFADLDQLELEGWPAASRPTRYRVAYWAAELLWRADRWDDCGEAFDRLVLMDPHGEYVEEAAYAAVLCHNNAALERQPEEAAQADALRRLRQGARRRSAEEQALEDRERLRPRELSADETAMIHAYSRYACAVQEGEDLVRIKYRRARIYYEANHWEEAAVLFRDVAVNHPGDELAPYAANLYLDCLNAISQLDAERRTACRGELTAAIDTFLGTLELIRDEEFRNRVTRLQCGILWDQAEASEAARRFREAGDLYTQIYSEYHDDCAQIGNHDLCEVLSRAASAYDSDDRIGQAIQIRTRLFQECGDESEWAQAHGNRASEWAKRALFQIGRNYESIASYTKAAQYYEDFARRYSGEKEAPDALARAADFRLRLGQDGQALQDAQLFAQRWTTDRSLARLAASISLAAGAVTLPARSGSWAYARAHHEAWLERFGDRAAVDDAIRARAVLARALIELGEPADRIEPLLRAGLALVDAGRPDGEPPTARRARYLKLLGDAAVEEGAQPGDRLRRMLDAVAEARFLVGEVGRAGGSRAQAEAAYRAAADEGSPTWALAALSRLGELALGGSGDDVAATSTMRAEAVAVLRRCLAEATRQHLDTTWSRACERRLNEIDPRAHPLNDDIHATPAYSTNPLAVPEMVREPRPLDADEAPDRDASR